jgi:hypothetical protein
MEPLERKKAGVATTTAAERPDAIDQPKRKAHQDRKEPTPPQTMEMEFRAIAKKAKQDVILGYRGFFPPVGIRRFQWLVVAQNFFSVDKEVGKGGPSNPTELGW